MLFRFLLIFLFQLTYTGRCLVFQSSSLTVDVGTRVTLTCNITSAFGQCSSVRWLLYQQEHGLKFYMSSFRTNSRKTQHDMLCMLIISQAKPSDNGTFYCLLLNEGVDYMGNGTALTVVAPDITKRQKVNTHDCKTDLQQIKEHQCFVPLVVLGGISLLIILGILAICACHRSAIFEHRRGNNASQQQSSSETQYATLRFVTGRHERLAKS